MTSVTSESTPATMRYRVTGMDCARCASEIKDAVRKIPDVLDVDVSIATQVITVSVKNTAATLPAVKSAVCGLGYQVHHLGGVGDDGLVDADDDDLTKNFNHITPAYRHALWIVVILNIGYGFIEILAGFIARSQALKADALDFLGDGMITLLGLMAIRWNLNWRARSALIQGIFLGILGLSVISTTIYRVFVVNQPEAELMGLFGGIALVVNVAAALVLIPHRTGDSNVRAIWLFSRNDAIGNVAVVIAAGLVAWTVTPWPDLVVAIVIAGLFLHSSWLIVGDALRELRRGASGQFPPKN